MTPAAAAPARIHAFDWLRGIAVVVMLQTHALVLLNEAATKTALFRWLVRVDGLVAPSFIFSAGFALALVQVRAAAAGRLAAQARKSLSRALEVLLVASLINAIWFPVWREPKWFLRIDILHCIGLSLLLVLPVLVGLATRPRVLRVVTLGLALVIFATSPFAEGATGAWSILLNTRPGVLDPTTATTFALFPWSGYVFLGASFGATVASMTSERQLWGWLGLLLGLGALLWWQEDPLRAAYPKHDFWVTNPANAAQRWTLVLSLVALLRLIEVRWPASVRSRVAQLVGTFGASSLSAYFFHQMLLYQRHVGVFTRFWRAQADFPLYAVLVTALVATTWACVKGWNRLEPQLRSRLPGGAPVTSSATPPRPAS
jgi:uncharacterized membrane protein